MGSTSKQSDSELIRVLDVGTSKVLAMVGRRTPDGDIKVLGVGHASGAGRKDGGIVDLEPAAAAIREAAARAARSSGVPFEHAIVSITGSHLLGARAQTRRALPSGSVVPRDVEAVEADARAADWGQDRELILLHRLNSRVDNLAVHDPIGMSGQQLEGNFQSITALRSRVETLRSCTGRAGVQALGFMPGAVALGMTAVTTDERDLGVAVVDMGAGTTNVAIFKENALCYFACIPLGGDKISTDISSVLRVSARIAEQVKIKHAAALASSADASKTFDTVGVDGQAMIGSPVLLSEVTEARVLEILEAVKKCLADSQVHDLPAGLVVTGGASVLRELGALGRSEFSQPWREASFKIPVDLAQDVSTAGAATAWAMLHAAPRPAPPRASGFLRRLFG